MVMKEFTLFIHFKIKKSISNYTTLLAWLSETLPEKIKFFYRTYSDLCVNCNTVISKEGICLI